MFGYRARASLYSGLRALADGKSRRRRGSDVMGRESGLLLLVAFGRFQPTTSPPSPQTLRSL